MKANMLDATHTRPPRVWSKLLLVVATAPALVPAPANMACLEAPMQVEEPAPAPEPMPEPAPAPRQLPTGSPACGNVASRAPRPPECDPPDEEAGCARPRVTASGSPACGNVTARPLPARPQPERSRRRR